MGTKSSGSSLVVGEDVGNLVGDSRIEHAFRLAVGASAGGVV